MTRLDYCIGPPRVVKALLSRLGLVVFLLLCLLGCDLLGLSKRVDVQILVVDVMDNPIAALVWVGRASDDAEIRVVPVGQTSGVREGIKATNENGLVMFHDFRPGVLFVMVDAEDYWSHWEYFEAYGTGTHGKRIELAEKP